MAESCGCTGSGITIAERMPTAEEIAALVEVGPHVHKVSSWAFVCVENQCVIEFNGDACMAAIVEHQAELKNFWHPVLGLTAQGWRVRPEWIVGASIVPFEDWPRWAEFGTYKHALSTTAKGDLAEVCVMDLLGTGRYPLRLEAVRVRDRTEQLRGIDLRLAPTDFTFQVTCDWSGGPKRSATVGTGFLFIQKSERNPDRHR